MNDRFVEAEPSLIVPAQRRQPFVISRAQRECWLWRGLTLLFISALVIRFYHLASHHWIEYMHDSASHAAYVEYLRLHYRLPPVDEGHLEYPQQPLYYLLAMPFYQTDKNWDQNLDNLAPLGFCLSTAALSFVFFSLRYLSSWPLRYGVFVFFAFTPAFVLASSCVGNDVLGVFWGAFYFFCILRFNRNPRAIRYFILTIGTLVAALLTKLNGVILFVALPWLLWRRAQHDISWKQTATRFAVITLMMALLGGGILYRAWSPAHRQFIFAHSWIWDYMAIHENSWVYALRFDLSGLISAGQTTTTNVTPDEVRFSFPSWEYGNMLLGEYEYNNDPVLLFYSRQLIVAGTSLLFGLVLFTIGAFLSRPVWPWQEIISLNRTALLLIVGSSCLILAFVHWAPVMCSADYRYQCSTFPWMGYAMARGLCAFPKSIFWRNTIMGFLGFYTYACISFLIALYIQRP
ncbi:MAG TPA: hypothetical protein VL981_12915 [Candidatus Methylacidiphilales bacterium]|nr:hypothetical protein [Candidatus Methylacidiphilales bacterium]